MYISRSRIIYKKKPRQRFTNIEVNAKHTNKNIFTIKLRSSSFLYRLKRNIHLQLSLLIPEFNSKMLTSTIHRAISPTISRKSQLERLIIPPRKASHLGISRHLATQTVGQEVHWCRGAVSLPWQQQDGGQNQSQRFIMAARSEIILKVPIVCRYESLLYS